MLNLLTEAQCHLTWISDISNKFSELLTELKGILCQLPFLTWFYQGKALYKGLSPSRLPVYDQAGSRIQAGHIPGSPLHHDRTAHLGSPNSRVK